jgi:pimeloyl-ACP methyl ester carboxylesterase
LRSRADVVPRRVGLLGIWSGAFVWGRAAAGSPAVGFIIPVVGGGGPLWRHELYRLHNEGVRAGLRAADVRALDSFMKDLYRPQTFAADGKARLTAALAHARGQRWLDVTPLKEFIDAPIDTAFALGRQAWANELSYDPAADLARLRARPALFLLGGADQNIDTALCAAEVHKHAPAARIVVLPKASHYLALSEPRPTAEQVTLSPRLFTSLEAFIARL